MNRGKVYIAGKITGCEELAKELFDLMESKLLEFGYEVINPMKIVPSGISRKAAMKILLPILLECDYIYLLANACISPGAMLERNIAEYCGITELTRDDVLKLSDPHNKVNDK